MVNSSLNTFKRPARPFIKHYVSAIEPGYRNAQVEVVFPGKKDYINLTATDGLKKPARIVEINDSLAKEEAILNAMMIAQHHKATQNMPKFKARRNFNFLLLILTLLISVIVGVLAIGSPQLFGSVEFITSILNFVEERILAITIGAGLVAGVSAVNSVRNSVIIADTEKNEFGITNSRVLNSVREDPKYRFGLSESLEERIDSVPLDHKIFDINSLRLYSLKELQAMQAYITAIKKAEAAYDENQSLDNIFEDMDLVGAPQPGAPKRKGLKPGKNARPFSKMHA